LKLDRNWDESNGDWVKLVKNYPCSFITWCMWCAAETAKKTCSLWCEK